MIEKSLVRILTVGNFLVTIFVLTNGVTDPVNAPKLLLLGGEAGALALLIIAFYGKSLVLRHKFLILMIFIFISTALLTSILSNAPFVQNFYGIYGRNTGLLTYLFLSLILISAANLKSINSYNKLILSLLCAGGVNLLYCLWVLLFGDFIAWNNPYGNILGTFGNPNFIGSFLGIIFSVFFTWLIKPAFPFKYRIVTLIILLLTAYEIQSSNAVQGKIVAAGGSFLVLFFWLRTHLKFKYFQIPYTLMVTIFAAFAIAGALQKGPLTQFIYKTSVSLRGEYWAAGFRMGMDHPFWGVGMDSYGDWYRRARDEQAMVLPGPNTVTNAAHNVVLDLFSNGGFPLVLSYLILLALTSQSILRYAKRMREFDPIFISLVTAWSGYQVQSIISINQIGLAVWGWLLTGALIGYEKLSREAVASDSKVLPKLNFKTKNSTAGSVSILSPGMIAGLGIVLGGFLAVPPISADMVWTRAVKSQSYAELEKSLQSTYLTPLNSFKLAQAVEMLEQSKLYDQAHQYAVQGTQFNPDYFEAWRFLYFSTRASEEDKRNALANMKRLDPLNRNLVN